MVGKVNRWPSLNFDFLFRYLKAKANRMNVVMTTPYEDAFGAGTVVTLSHVLFEGK